MSTQVFPDLRGLAWDVKRTPQWNNIISESVSGKETAIGLWSYPRYQWELSYNFLRSDAANHEFQDLLGFFNARSGNFDSFLFTDADDYSAAAQSIGTGDGATAAFQLVRAFGGYVEPILAPNTVSAVYLAGVSVPAAGVSAPTNGALSTTSAGALGATTYYVKTTWVTNSGETLASAETNVAALANKVLNVAAPGSAPAGAIGWNVYVSNTAGGGAGAETRQNGGTPVALATPWVEPTSGLVAGAALPVANTTGWSVAPWGGSAPGVLTFAGNVRSTIAVTADFTFYFPVRFVDASIDFNKFTNQIYENKSIKMRSLK